MPHAKTPAPAVEPELSGSEYPPLVTRIEEELELLVRNVEVLETLAKHTPAGIIRLSEALKLPVHKTRYSLHLLEREGVIQPSADGAVVTDRETEFWASLRGALERMSTIVQRLKAKAAEHAPTGGPVRKGY